MFFGSTAEYTGNQSTYDASPEGLRAAYLLLDELGYPVVRSRRAAEGKVRWVLFPTYPEKEVDAVDRWVRDGGILVLGDTSETFAEKMGLRLDIQHYAEHPEYEIASGWNLSSLAGGNSRVECPDQPGRVEIKAAGQPFITVYQRGHGEIWLLNRPEFLKNKLLGKADNGILLCRLAEAVLQGKSAGLAFDEFFHGMRDRPGVTELLLRPPTLWLTLQGVLLTGLLLWHLAPRFGKIRLEVVSSRRSRAEFLEAMASLLERKGDYAEAWSTVRDNLVRSMEQELGLPAGTPSDGLLREAARRRPIRLEVFRAALDPQALPPGAGRNVFLQAMNDLETVRREFFHGNHH
jgi:hypothetical protein